MGGGHVHGNADVGADARRRGLGAAAAELLLDGEYIIYIVGISAVVLAQGLYHLEAARAVVKALRGDEAVLERQVLSVIAADGADLYILLGVLLALGADVYVELAYVVVSVLNGAHAAYHANYAVAEPDASVVRRSGPVPAHIADAEPSVGLYLLDHEAYLVHVGGEHNLLRVGTRPALFEDNQAAERVYHDLVGVGPDLGLYELADLLLVSGDALCLGQTLQQRFVSHGFSSLL